MTKEYLIKVTNRENEEEEYQVTKVFEGKDEAKALRYFNQLKANMQSHQPDDYYDEEDEILYRDIKISLYENDKRLRYATIG